MLKIIASAPGKAVVAGEYAVLAGAPAVAMALNRRARVRIDEIDDSAHCVSAPGYLEDSFRFQAGADAEIVWLDEIPSRDSFALLECVWKQAGVTRKGGLSVTLDTEAFFDDATSAKLGLGSSAALATALTAALVATQTEPGAIHSLAAKAHCKFQQGLGSGIDVATAVHGGVIEYQIDAPVAALQWPEGLAFRLLWSGEAASTRSKLERFNGQADLPSRERLAAQAQDVLAAWKAGDNASLLSILRIYTNTLRDFGIDHELGIFEAGHQALAARAETIPKTVYKPCGAGGGDVGIVLAESMRNLELFTAAAIDAGFVPLDISLDPDGVIVEDKSSC